MPANERGSRTKTTKKKQSSKPAAKTTKKKPNKGKAVRVTKDGKTRSVGQAGKTPKPGTKKGDAYCARSAGIKKCKNPPCPNDISRKRWKCKGKKSTK